MPLIDSLTDLRKLKRDIESFYGNLHRDIAEDDVFYRLDFAEHLNLPKEVRQLGIALPTAREVVDAAVDHIDPRLRRVEVPRKSSAVSAVNQANELKFFYEAFLAYFDRRYSASPYRLAAKNMVLSGMGVLKLLYDRTHRPEEPVQGTEEDYGDYEARRSLWEQDKDISLPFVLHTPHPKNVFPDPWNDVPEWVIESRKMYVGQAISLYPEWKNARNRANTTQVTVCEYWTRTHRSVLIDDSPAFGDLMVSHDWGDHPYVFAASGYGYHSEDAEPRHLYVGVLRHLHAILIAQSRMYSVGDILVRNSVWPERYLIGDRASEMGDDYRPKVGHTKTLPAGVEIKTITPEVPIELIQDFMEMNSRLIAAVSPRIVRGGREPGTSSGFDNQVQLIQARLRYQPLADAMENLLSALCTKAGLFMENMVKSPVSLAGGATQDEYGSISGKAWRGHRAVRVRINVLEPEDEVRKHNDQLQLLSANVTTEEDVIRKISPEKDPKTVQRNRRKERIVDAVLPVIAQAAAQEIAQRLGIEQAIEEAVKGQGRTPAQPEELSEPPLPGNRSIQGQQRRADGRATGTGR